METGEKDGEEPDADAAEQDDGQAQAPNGRGEEFEDRIVEPGFERTEVAHQHGGYVVFEGFEAVEGFVGLVVDSRKQRFVGLHAGVGEHGAAQQNEDDGAERAANADEGHVLL
jgi:hypothetical protein